VENEPAKALSDWIYSVTERILLEGLRVTDSGEVMGFTIGRVNCAGSHSVLPAGAALDDYESVVTGGVNAWRESGFADSTLYGIPFSGVLPAGLAILWGRLPWHRLQSDA